MIEDSPHRCPHCSKRMMLELGQDDNGVLEEIHHCWSCGYAMRRRPKLRVVHGDGGTAAARLYRLRTGRSA